MEPFPVLQTPPPHNRPSPPITRSSSSKLQHRRPRKSTGLGDGLPGDVEGPTPSISNLVSRLPGVPSSNTNSPDRPGRQAQRRRKTLLRNSRSFVIRHSWILPLAICAAISSLYLLNPDPSNPFSACLFLSYPIPQESADAPLQYGKGNRDFAFIAFYTVFFTFTREFMMQRVIRPMAARTAIPRGKYVRFTEQVYAAMYFGTFGFLGFYIMSLTPVWYFDTTAMFVGFPHKTHIAPFKAYYLLQSSYWVQQMLVMLAGLEKRRKDFKELIVHHFITISLIWLSYSFHFTYCGLAVFIAHDLSDFVFALSKTFNYLEVTNYFLGPFFGFFIVVWVYLRHYIFCQLIAALTPLPMPAFYAWINSLLANNISSSLAILPTEPIFPDWISKYAAISPYILDYETRQYKFWGSHMVFYGFLSLLEGLNLFWFFLILRVAYRFATENIAEDSRSDSEEEIDEVVEEEKKVLKKVLANGAVHGTSSNGKVH